MLAAVLLVSRVKLDVTIPGPLVFEHAQAIVASERHLVAVSLMIRDTQTMVISGNGRAPKRAVMARRGWLFFVRQRLPVRAS